MATQVILLMFVKAEEKPVKVMNGNIYNIFIYAGMTER